MRLVDVRTHSPSQFLALCRCGSSSHRRTTHRECPLNVSLPSSPIPLNVPVPSSPIPLNVLVPSSPIPLHLSLHSSPIPMSNVRNVRRRIALSCPACGSTSHQRITHLDCPMNPRHRNPQNIPSLHQSSTLDKDPVNSPLPGPATILAKVTPGNSAHGPWYKKAAKSYNFNQNDVFGPEVCHLEGHSYRRHVLPEMDTVCKHCGSKMWLNERLSTSSKKNPVYGMCCIKGKIKIPLPRPPPEPLLTWVLDHSSEPVANDFHKHIRAYNTIFAFASIVVQEVSEDTAPGPSRIQDRPSNGSSGPRPSTGASSTTRANDTFRINGTIHHRIGSLRPSSGPPAFAQVYFYDLQEQLQHRTSLISHLRPDTIEILQRLITINNPYASRFQTLFQQYGSEPIGTLQLSIRSGRQLGRRYDAQTYPEVSAMVTEETMDGAFSPHDIVVREHSTGTKIISSLNPSYMPLHYVLMYPFGEDGWSPGMLSSVSTASGSASDDGLDDALPPGADAGYKMSLLQYCAYMLMIRDGYYLQHYDRLFQQYVVDNYVRIEASRLTFMKNNQDTLRAEMYSGIGDGVDPRQVGRSIVLPSSFTGGPRYMRQMLQDGLAIIRQKGKPSLFITITCNPKWPDLVAALPPGQSIYDRPDISSRVFQLKVDDIMDKWTIETDRPIGPEHYDKYICAEIPDRHSNPGLFDTVIKSMIHGPCGSKCLTKNPRTGLSWCKNGYPKAFQDESRLNDVGYPVYRRRQTAPTHRFPTSDFVADSRHVIPYNPYMSQKYNCHINTEICTTSSAVKYLCKYITKGSSRSEFQSVSDSNADGGAVEVNEVTQYQNSRYVGPCEAVWRTLRFKIHIHHPTVVRLNLHLPEKQMVRFDAEMTPEQLELARQSCKEGTKLLDFFRLCSDDESARRLTYSEIPSRYAWQAKPRKWTRRTRPPIQNVVSRIYSARISNIELFSLRLLLLHVQGPLSFDDLRTFDGTIHSTFQGCALARGLLQSDNEWERCMQEAVAMETSVEICKELAKSPTGSFSNISRCLLPFPSFPSSIPYGIV
ncbi:hypothetical protein [Absidia glauca]|uniref:Helitron helicase-like domain-containing protein n=1 Tax=Absidia glauca TaxID=4829 RepID=A0A163IXX9_ABSGL|nr:hypothetical protein [Absidia glauca]